MGQAQIQIEGAVTTVQMNPKEFKTGSKGYHGFGKLEVSNGKKYQLNVMAIEIGSKKKD